MTEAGSRPWWRNVFPLAVFAALWLLLWAVIWLPPDWPRDFRWVATYAVSAVMLLAVGVWFWFFAAFKRRTRLGVSLVVLLVLAGVVAAFELEGFDGDLGPIVRLRRWNRPQVPQDRLLVRPAKPLEVASSEADWPGFLGPQRNGVVPGWEDQARWDTASWERLWSVELGKGWSSYAVAGGFAFTQEMYGQREYVVCLEVTSGRVMWRSAQAPEEERAAQGFRSRLGGDGPRATPTVVDGRVYAYSSQGVLSCFEAATGRRLWHRAVLAPYGNQPPRWGCASSPLVVDGLVVVGGGGGRSPALLAFHARDGKPAWQAGPRGGSSDVYDSPAVATLCGVRQILYVSDQQVAGYEVATGRELWHHRWPWPAAQHPKVPQALVVDSTRVVIAAGYDSGTALLELRRNEQGKLQPRLLWKNRNLKPKFTNPVVYQGHLFGLDMGILTCLDLANGRRRWKRGRFGHGQLLRLGSVLLIQAESGELALVRADPRRYRLLGRVPALADKTWNVPAVAGPLVLVRNDRQGMCFRLPETKAE